MEFIKAKQIVNPTSDSYWFGTEYTMNIYRGCCHGCIYCDSRSRCYNVNEFNKIKVKENALEIIENDLRRKNKKGIIGTGSMSDPYNPLEQKLRLTRGALELVDEYGFGIFIATKGKLLMRDVDILRRIKKHSPVICAVTITCADDGMSKKIEPDAPSSSERFQILRKLWDEGIYCGVLLGPVLPYITDSIQNILQVVQKAHEAGASFIYPTFGVTLRDNQRNYFYDKLDQKFPGIKENYIRDYGDTYYCSIKDFNSVYDSFKNECDKYGLLHNMQQIISAAKRNYEFDQLSFLDYIDLEK